MKWNAWALTHVMNANNALNYVKMLFALKMESQFSESHTARLPCDQRLDFCATQIRSKTMWWLTWKILFHWDSASKVSTWWARQSDWRMQDGALGWTAPSLAPHLPRPWLRWGFLHGRLCQDCGRRKRTYSGNEKSKTYIKGQSSALDLMNAQCALALTEVELSDSAFCLLPPVPGKLY